MTRKQKKILIRIIISFVLLAAEMIFFAVSGMEKGLTMLILYLIPCLIIGYDVLRRAFLGIIRLNMLDENFLMTIAAIGAFATGEYAEGTAVILFYQIGELFQSYAVNKSRKSISELMDIRPDYANIENQNGELEQVSPEEITAGSVIVVKPGERIPLDGVIISGTTAIDTTALTGEAVPRDASEGDTVISGCINQNGLIKVKVTREFADSTVSRILELVENAQEKKSRNENFITAFSRIYTPAVVAAAAMLAIIPPLVTGGAFSDWVHRAMTFLVISCPCALVISVPLSYFCGIGAASKRGILIKGSCFIDALSKAETAVFDKTGTLTKGSFEVTEIHSVNGDNEFLLRTAAAAEMFSDHPAAVSLRKACDKSEALPEIKDSHEIPGHGVIADFADGDHAVIGNIKLMKRENIAEAEDIKHSGTIIHAALNGKYLGYIIISDSIKEQSAQAVAELKNAGVSKTVMLTGDDDYAAKECAHSIGIDEYYARVLPDEKVKLTEKLMTEKSDNKTLIFTGDGINDAPVLTRADVGIAMGGIGSDAAIEAADIVIMDDDPKKIAEAVRLSRRIVSAVRVNIVFILTVKFAVLILGALDLAGMWAAVFADVGVSVIAIINACRERKDR